MSSTSISTTPDKLRVLLIEDDESDVFLVREILKGSAAKTPLPHELVVAESLSEGLKALAGGVDVVLLDLNLPDSRGIETLRRVVAAADGTPVVVLSGVNDDKLSMEAAANGAQDYLVKGQVESMWLSRIMRYAVARQSSANSRASNANAALASQVAKSMEALDSEARARQNAQSSLDEHSRLLTAILDSIPDGVIACDPSGNIILANRACHKIAAADLMGYTPEQLKSRFEYFKADKKTPYPFEELALMRCLRGENVDDDVFFLRTSARPAGYWVSLNARPVRDPAGNVTAAVAVFRDITILKDVEERLAEQRSCLDLLGHAAATANLADSTPAALHDSLKVICNTFGWDAGHAMFYDRAVGKIRTTGTWHLGDMTLEPFKKAAGPVELLPEQGQVGKAVATGKVSWTSDLGLDAHCPRAPMAARVGLKFSLATPLRTPRGVIGAFEFFSKNQSGPPSPSSLNALDQVGIHLGRMVERLPRP